MVRLTLWICLIYSVLLSIPSEWARGEGLAPIHHELRIQLNPASHELRGTDRVLIPEERLAGKQHVVLRLHAGLNVSCEDPAYELEPGAELPPSSGWAVPLREYRLSPVTGAWQAPVHVLLSLEGQIYHPLEREAEEYARSFSRTPGVIGEEGIYLSAGSAWYPQIDDELVTFDLSVGLPSGWDAVSQGWRNGVAESDGRSRTRWVCPHPMDSIYLVAARFTKYQRAAGNVMAQVFFREPDPNLAQKYLEATAQYVDMYTRLIGPYPYKKFALVENFWETGYGMPSFTLLGPKVIRFPFILHSSYPHEILHNWWGNSVFVDMSRGNWCEGITAYLADHLVKEGQGKGTEYRRDTLKRYANYVQQGNEIALVEFRQRHSSASEAVGYGKSLMLFHMLRRQLGDEVFVRGLQRFYREFRFRRASFDDVTQVFSAVAERDLKPFFDQWIDRKGAPDLVLADFFAAGSPKSGYALKFTLEQSQPGPAFHLDVPVALYLENHLEPEMLQFTMTEKRQEFEMRSDFAPQYVQVDPHFDLFRKLDREEVPPTAGEVFGAKAVTIVCPSKSAKIDAAVWQQLANTWSGDAGDVQVVRDDEIEELPEGRGIWLLGTENRFRDRVSSSIQDFGAVLHEHFVEVDRKASDLGGHSFLFVARDDEDPGRAIGWIGGGTAAGVPGLARKLPHYGKYSYLVFRGDEPDNVIKGQWPVSGSPMVDDLRLGPARNEPLALPVREALAERGAVFDPAVLAGHVQFLADPSQEGRGVGTQGLDRAGDYIAQQFEEAGLSPAGDDGTFFQSWVEKDGPEGRSVTLRNVVAVLPGTDSDWKQESVVLGAHYDHLGFGWPDVRSGNEGQLHPGADDNASGVAVLLEVAKLLKQQLTPRRTLIFVAFSGEEWGCKGSEHYVRTMKQWPAARAHAMINLDSVGRLHDRKISVLGAGTATEWIHIAMGIGFTTGVESQSILDDPGGSDQKSFHAVGVPAVQLFTGAHENYHRPSDTVERVDTEGLVRVATFVREGLVYLSERDRPLTSKLEQSSTSRPQPAPAQGSGRRVSFGTVPDFAFSGPGVRVTSVIPGSPAALAGVQGGDRLVAIDGAEVKDLAGYSALLRKYAPGNEIVVELERDGQRKTVQATLRAR